MDGNGCKTYVFDLVRPGSRRRLLMLEIPQLWHNTARKHGGIIAGGALRDLYFNRLPPKDLDIFVPGLKQEETDDIEDYVRGTVMRVTNETLSDGTKLQLIKHRFLNADDLLAHFDTGISRIAYDPGRGWQPWIITPEFLEDAANHTITVYDHNYLHEQHLASIVAKYPDFKVQDVTATNMFDWEISEHVDWRGADEPVCVCNR